MEASQQPRRQEVQLHRAQAHEIDAAWQIVTEYYKAANVVAQDSKDQFAAIYFSGGAGVWLAGAGTNIVGCIALRRLTSTENAGEVKRLYVRPAHRGRGIAASLYRSLENYTAEVGYQYLYLDTTDSMIAAQRFYEALGYKTCPRYNDNPQATIFMRKELNSSGRMNFSDSGT